MKPDYSHIYFQQSGKLKLLIIVGTRHEIIRLSAVITERPDALDKACFVLAGIDVHSLLQAVEVAVELNRSGNYGMLVVPDYTEENVSTKEVKTIQSYAAVVDRMVWRKN